MRKSIGVIDPERDVVGMLASGEIVIDRPNSHNHLNTSVLEEALPMIDAVGRDHLDEQVRFAGEIGVSQCVETKADDQIILAYRVGREGPTRFVLNREPENTNLANVILQRSESRDGLMILVSAWAGGKSQPEPWDKNLKTKEEKDRSVEFWNSHALIWGSAIIDGAHPIVELPQPN